MSAEPAIPPQEFAQAILDAFESAGHYDDVAVRAARGPSSTTMTKYRKVALGVETMTEPRGDSYKAIENAAGWEPGSARRLWRKGETPTPLLPEVRSDLSAKFRRLLAEMDLDGEDRGKLEALVDELDESAS